MSHFSVVVITKGDQTIEELMAPYHEFECTGQNDQYVKDIDITDEILEEFKTGTINKLRDEYGQLHCPYDDMFYREPTPEEKNKIGDIGTGCSYGIQCTSKDWNDGKGYRPKVRFIPSNMEEVSVPYSEVMTLAKFAEDWHSLKVVPFGGKPDLENDHKYGYILADEFGDVLKIITRTNPNAKWDGWRVGGRWNGHFKVKPEFLSEAHLSAPTWDSGGSKGIGYADSLPVKALDWHGMCEERKLESNKKYDLLEQLTKGINPPIEDWETCRERHENIQDARDVYNNHPFIKAVSQNRELGLWSDPIKEYCVISGGRQEYIRQQVNKVGVPFAVVMDGNWYQKGEMGWFGMSTNDKTQESWNTEFHKLMDSLSENDIVTIVDCHI